MTDPGRIPGPLVAPSTVQVRLGWSLPNTKVVHNVLHASCAGGFTATSTIAEAIFSAIKADGAWTAYKAKLNAGVSFVSVDLRDQRSANLPIVASTSGSSAGTGAGVALPEQDALVVSLRTDFAGRGFRGRVYLPGFDSTAVAAGGVAAAGTMTAAVDFVTAVEAAMAASGLTLSIPQFARAGYTSAKTGAVHPARAAIAPIAVTDILCLDNIFDAQRRRSAP